MKKRIVIILSILFYLSIGFACWAQTDYIDIVYLKNGSIIKGMIVEQIPGVSVKIETPDGSVIIVKVDEIERITKEKVKKDEAAKEEKREEPAKEPAKEPAEVSKGEAPKAFTPDAFTKVTIGIQAGINLASFSGEDSQASLFGALEKSPRIGFTTGLFFNFPFAEFVCLQMEIMYSGKGDVYGSKFASDLYWHTAVILHAFELPILLYINVPATKVFYPHAIIGVAPGYFVSSKYSYSENVYGAKYTETGDVESVFGLEAEKFTFGIVFGGGFTFNLSGYKIILDLRYNLGLLQGFKLYGTELDIKPNAFSILIGTGYKL